MFPISKNCVYIAFMTFTKSKSNMNIGDMKECISKCVNDLNNMLEVISLIDQKLPLSEMKERIDDDDDDDGDDAEQLRMLTSSIEGVFRRDEAD